MISFLKGIIFYFIFNQILGFLIISVFALLGKDEDIIEPFCVMSTMPLSLLLFNCITKPVYKIVYNLFSYECYIYQGKNNIKGFILLHPFRRKKVFSKKKRYNLTEYRKCGFNSKKSWKEYFNLSEISSGKGYLYSIKVKEDIGE